MGWLFKTEQETEQEKWDKQIRMDKRGDWTQQALASRMEVCPKNPRHGGQGSRETGDSRTFPWDVTETEGAQRARSKGWWK